MNTEELIAKLSFDTPPKKLRSPAYYAKRLAMALTVYGAGVQLLLGLRPDLLTQLSRPLFAAEILLLLSLTISGTTAAILSMYPDHYQRGRALSLPYVLFSLLVLLMLSQLLMPHDARMAVPEPEEAHHPECALCIAGVALIPSALIFALLRKGATVTPLQAGSFSVLAASGLACLTLRLEEANDSLPHLIQWHYLPTLLFAAFGALIGEKLLRW